MIDRYKVGLKPPGRISTLEIHCAKKADAFAEAEQLAASNALPAYVYDRCAHPGKPQTWHVAVDGSAFCVEYRP